MSGPMGLVYPTPGDTTDTWGVVLNTLLGLVENHDHTPGKGSLIRSAALGINADVSWAAFALTAAKAVTFSEVTTATVTAYADALFVNAADHNLYFRNGSGTNVQVTAGATLNISIVGGIGGDYSTVGALFSYDDATRRYLAQQEGSPRPWAGFGTGDIDLYQKAASISNKVTLKSPNALVASYPLVFPAALPPSTALFAVDNAGNITVVGTSLAPGPVIYAADFKVSSPTTLQIPNAAADLNANGRLISGTTGRCAIVLGGGIGANGVSTFPIPLRVGDQITGWTIYLVKVSSAASTISAQLFASTTINGLGVAVTPDASVSTSANNPSGMSMGATGLSHTVVAGQAWSVGVGMSAGAAITDEVTHLEVTYVRP